MDSDWRFPGCAVIRKIDINDQFCEIWYGKINRIAYQNGTRRHGRLRETTKSEDAVRTSRDRRPLIAQRNLRRPNAQGQSPECIRQHDADTLTANRYICNLPERLVIEM